MLQEFLRRGKKGQTNLFPISGRVPVLNLEFAHCRSGFQPMVENLPKGRHGSGGFLGERWICLVTTKTFAGRSASQKQKIRWPPTPKNPPQNLPACQTCKWDWALQVHAGLFSIEKKVFSWRRLQSMDSGTLFGCLQGMVEAPMLKCTRNPSAAAGGRDNLCCAPFQTTLLVKSVRFEETTQK